MLSDSASGPRFGRRTLLRAGLTAVAGTPAVAALLSSCDAGYAGDSDPLLPLLTAARTDVAAAKNLPDSGSAAGVAQTIVEVRGEHAEVLQAEIDRMNRPLPHQQSAPTTNVSTLAQLAPRLSSTHHQAVSLVPELPKYRAAVVGSVAAGCAGLQQLSPHLEPADSSEATGDSEETGDSEDSGNAPTDITADEAAELGDEARNALQTALAAEYAASWVYDFATAYLPAPFGKSVERGRSVHQRLARNTRRLLTAAGAEPEPRQAAYVPDNRVNDKAGAMRTIVTAESDTSRSWRGVLARTEDAALRTGAARALSAAARRVTPWRVEAEIDPIVVSLPGKS